MCLPRPLRAALHAFCLAAALLAAPATQAAIDPEPLTAVPVVQDGRLTVTTNKGTGTMPIHVSRDWSQPQPDVARAIIVIPGWPRRDLTSGERAAASAGDAARHTLLITPQFLIQTDIDSHHLGDDVLHWGLNDWLIGYDAHGPAPISSFDVLDTILARLADRRLFPNLAVVVVAGHSAGGQFVQRYAAIAHGEGPLLRAGIHIRYVVANPSTYVYFSTDRPAAGAAPVCAAAHRWGYGLDSHLPTYVTQPVDRAALERDYRARDITYLLGTADNDPQHYQLDRSCGAEAEGPNRLARGLAYFAYLQSRGSTPLNQRVLQVPGVGHHSPAMYGSACGLAALFDLAGCAPPP